MWAVCCGLFESREHPQDPMHIDAVVAPAAYFRRTKRAKTPYTVRYVKRILWHGGLPTKTGSAEWAAVYTIVAGKKASAGLYEWQRGQHGLAPGEHICTKKSLATWAQGSVVVGQSWSRKVNTIVVTVISVEHDLVWVYKPTSTVDSRMSIPTTTFINEFTLVGA